MTDRELLELAAKAAGIAYIKPAEGYDGSLGLAAGSHPMQTHPWNPLTDDGDALRLAVKLCLDLRQSESMVVAEREFPTEVGVAQMKELDPLAATRRAIVRVAAEIGRKMT
jgi:hypothetical protein